MSVKRIGNVTRLTPDIKQYIIDEFYCFVLLITMILMSGIDYKIGAIMAGIGTVIMLVYLIGRWWYYTNLIWEITPTQIKSIRGIVNKSTNFIEMYRVVDFMENQSLLQQFFGLKDVYILSGDRTDAVLRIYGIPNNLNIIEEIKPLIAKCRKENRIYEIANH